MILLTLAKRPHECRVEINGVDLSDKLTGLTLEAKLGTAVTRITLELLDDVVIIGDPGRLEFHKRAPK